MKRDFWLTPKRLRAHGMILAVCLWSVYVWNISGPGLRDRGGVIKGADFIHLYTLGSVALKHRTADLYNPIAQAELTAQRVPAAAGVAYIPLYPPQVSIFFAPLAALPYGIALIIWLILDVFVYSVCCYMLWRACTNLRNERGIVLLLTFAFPGFFHLIVWGQTSAIALACFTATFFCLQDGRPFLAGLALGCLIFKPQLGLAAAFVFVYTRAWRVIAGTVLSAVAQLAVPALYYGTESLRLWIHTILNVAYNVPLLEPRPYQTHSLWTFWTMLVPGTGTAMALYVLSGVLILGLTIAVWTRTPGQPLAVRYSSLLLASILVSPHLIVYDLAILAPVFLLLADWIMSRGPSNISGLTTVLYLVYLAPLVGPLTRWTHVQVSVMLMSILLYMIWRDNRVPAVAN